MGAISRPEFEGFWVTRAREVLPYSLRSNFVGRGRSGTVGTARGLSQEEGRAGKEHQTQAY